MVAMGLHRESFIAAMAAPTHAWAVLLFLERTALAATGLPQLSFIAAMAVSTQSGCERYSVIRSHSRSRAMRSICARQVATSSPRSCVRRVCRAAMTLARV